MFHMLVCFDLKPGVVIDEFRNSVGGSPSICEASISRLASAPIGARQSDTPLDTDRERSHQYFVTMSFRDRQQSDLAYQYLKEHIEPGHSIQGSELKGCQSDLHLLV